jgi:hypothetical protein
MFLLQLRKTKTQPVYSEPSFPSAAAFAGLA